jgi:AcrR family transcriptional regulator
MREEIERTAARRAKGPPVTELTVRWRSRQVEDTDLPALRRALIDEVGERGYRRATINDVCSRAALPPERFGEYFEDLDEACCDVFSAVLGEAFERLLPAFDAHEHWPDRIRAAAYALFAYVDEDRTRGRFMTIEVLSAGEGAAALRDESLELLTEMIDLGRQEMDDPDRLTRATAEAIAGTTYRTLRLALENDDLDAFKLLPSLMYSVVLPYAGAAAALRELTLIPPHVSGDGLGGPGVSREDLISALIEDAAARSYSRTSIATVCERAKATEAEFLAHFEDLGNCACQAMELIEAQVVERIEATVARQPEWRSQLRAAAYELAEYMLEDRSRARFIMLESLAIDRPEYLIRHDPMGIAVDLIHQGRDELADPSSVDRATAEQAAVQLFYAVAAEVQAPSGRGTEALLRELLCALVEPYVGRQEAERELIAPRPR